MTGREVLRDRIRDEAAVANINAITDAFVQTIHPMKVILFGSFADGTYTDDSDYDFYLVVEDGRHLGKTTDDAYRSIRFLRNRPVDIVVGHDTYFDEKGHDPRTLKIEGEVQKKGVLLYDQKGGLPS